MKKIMQIYGPSDVTLLVGVNGIIWINAVDVITTISDIEKLVFQIAIGILTVLYLRYKIKLIKKQNKDYDEKNQGNE